MKLKLILTVVFILAYSIAYYINDKTMNKIIDLELNKQIENLKVQYALTKEYFIADAKSIRSDLLSNKKVISIFSKAQNATNEQKALLREELYQLLLPMYKRLQTKGVLQVQFVFTDNVSFLRMHKPSKFGDDLTSVRHSFKQTNLNQIVLEGFEQGRVTHGFRYTFPYYDENKKHIGAVDIALASYALQDKLLNVSKIHSHFLVKKEVFDVKAWKIEKLEKEYIQSLENEEYLHSVTKQSDLEELRSAEKRIIPHLQSSIDKNMRLENSFAVYSPFEESIKVLAFLPVKNIKEKTVAYLVSYTDSDNIYHLLKNNKIVNIIIFIGMLLLFYFIHKNLNRKDELDLEVKRKTAELKYLNENLENKVREKTRDLNDKNNELEALVSSYDKNVMYSSTDLNGVITDVSEAFCRMSGYTREELIGQEHNIVRHPDTPASTFKEIWEKLEAEETFESEIKNLKKDGGYFWVKSFFAPEYDKYGNHIGYTCVRDSITDRKEVEDLQTEIEETQKEVIFRMGSIGESRSKETGYHVKRVAEYSKILALHYGLSEEEAELLKQASPMHDIGKVAIPDNILNKPGKLTDDEMQIMKRHAELGYDMLKSSTRPLLGTAAVVAYQHHENWDGTGYPQGLEGHDIHIYGRITALADVFDALGSDRVYKKAWSDEKIFEYFRAEQGKQFEPKLVDIFCDNLDEFLAVRDRLVDK